MGCTYVKEFSFGGKVPAAKKYAKGGVVEKESGEIYPSKKAMMKHEKEETPRMRKEELIQKTSTKMPARKGVPVAPLAPMFGMKKGGMAAFEKSGKDVEKRVMKEGSKADMALDKKQMMGMKKGGKVNC